MNKFIRRQGGRVFDVYLYLLKKSKGKLRAPFKLNYSVLAKALGISHMTSEAYRRQIIKVLRKLERQYGLIEFKPRHGREARIVLKKSGPMMPKEYWTYGWVRGLSFSGKMMYLIHARHAEEKPGSWQVAQGTLRKRFRLSRGFISEGATELRRKGLLGIQYDVLKRRDNRKRYPAIYTLRPLYNRDELKKDFAEMERFYGRTKAGPARRYARLVYADSDVQGMEHLIALQERFGRKVMERAAHVIRLKHPNNPKRTMAYFLKTIERMGKSESV